MQAGWGGARVAGCRLAAEGCRLHLAGGVEAGRGARPGEELRPRGEGPRGGHVDEAVHEGRLGGVTVRVTVRVAVRVRVRVRVSGEGEGEW